MDKEFSGYPLFEGDEIKSRQAFNRLITSNLIRVNTKNDKLCKEYLDLFSKKELFNIALVVSAIADKGLEKVRQEIFAEQNSYGELMNG